MATDVEYVSLDEYLASPPQQVGYKPPEPQPASPASFWQRALASFKSSPESEANFYATRFGAENVQVTRDKRVQIRDPKTGKWADADPDGFDLGDIADVAGSLPEVVGGIVGGVKGFAAGAIGGLGVGAVPGAMAGGAVGSAAGNALKQAVGALIPGEEVETLGQRAGEVTLAGAMGAAGEGVGHVVHKGFVRPAMHALYSRGMARAPEKALEAEAIEQVVNRGARPGDPQLMYTPGELTGGRGISMVEDVSRNSVTGADPFFDRARQNLAAVQAKALRLIDEVRAGAPGMSDTGIGSQIGTMFKEIDDNMLGALQDRATREFAVLDTPAASRMKFATPNLASTLQELAARDVTSEGVKGPIAEGVERLLAELPQKGMTLKDINLFLQRFGRMGYGKGDKSFMERLGDTDRAKMSRQLFAALSKDVDDYAQSGAPGRTMMRQMMQAKDNFKAGLNEIDAWQNGLFAKVVGNHGPESAARIVDNLFKLKPDEVKSVMTVVGYRPDVANAVRANWIERAVEKSVSRSLARAGSEPFFDARTFADALGTPQQIEALFGRTHKEVLADLVTLKRAVARMHSSTFQDSASLVGRSRAATLVQAIPQPSRWLSAAREILVPAKLARVLLDPKARHELNVIADAKAPTRRVAAAITYLLGQEAADLPEQ